MIVPSILFVKKQFLQKNLSRPFMQWLIIAANKIDIDRLKEFGPDRVCAEWLLRNGASLKWIGAKNFLTDYNALPPEGTLLHIEKIDATGSSISHYGFLHLKDCNYIQEIKLNKCDYIENSALKQLSFVKNTLEYLQVADCGNITDNGLLYLKDLKKLKILEIFELMYVDNKLKVLQELRNSLQDCKITTDFEEDTANC